MIEFRHFAIHAQNSSATTKRDRLLGTDFYRPPELAKPGSMFDGKIANRFDIWCWGMLLWEVLLDGSLNVSKKEHAKHAKFRLSSLELQSKARIW